MICVCGAFHFSAFSLDNEQITPAFWSDEQRVESETIKLVQSSKQLSVPEQSQLLSHCDEPPSPKRESVTALLPVPYPSCWQTTLASKMSQESSHTVCHTPPKRTSTRPAYWSPPPTNLSCVEHVAADSMYNYIQMYVETRNDCSKVSFHVYVDSLYTSACRHCEMLWMYVCWLIGLLFSIYRVDNPTPASILTSWFQCQLEIGAGIGSAMWDYHELG